MERTAIYETDALTGLGHRRAFAAALERSGPAAGILLADLRGLGAVDKAMGYRAGDEYLLLAAKLLQELVPPQGTAYRAEGGRFALLLPGADAETLSALEKRLRQGFEEGCPSWLKELGGGLSIGWAAGGGSGEETCALARSRLGMDRAGR